MRIMAIRGLWSWAMAKLRGQHGFIKLGSNSDQHIIFLHLETLAFLAGIITISSVCGIT